MHDEFDRKAWSDAADHADVPQKCSTCGRSPNPTRLVDIFLLMAPPVDAQAPDYLCVECYVKDYRKFDAVSNPAVQTPSGSAHVSIEGKAKTNGKERRRREDRVAERRKDARRPGGNAAGR